MTTVLSLTQDATRPWRVVYSGLQFPGEVAVAAAWRSALGAALPPDLSFRVVFLRSRATIQPSALARGIIVAVPGTRPSQETQQATRQLSALREVQAGYATSASHELRAIGRALGQEEQEATVRLQGGLAQGYAAGTVVAATPVRAEPAAVFRAQDSAAWADALAHAVLASALPELPITPSLLPRPVTPADVRPLLAAIGGLAPRAPGESDAAVLLAGLHLRRQDMERSPVLEFIRERLERKGRLELGALLGDLAVNFGLPRYLSPVHAIAYVARNRPASELLLKDGHAIRHRGGAPFLGDRLSWDVLPDLAWPEDLEAIALAITPPQPPSLRSALPYAVELVPNLQSMRTPLTEQDQAILAEQALQALRRQVGEAQAGLAMLHTTLDVPSALPAFGPLHALERVTGSHDLLEFHQACARAGLTLEALRAALMAFRKLRPLAAAAQELLQARAYLLDVAPTLGEEMEQACRLLMARLDLLSLEADPSALAAVRQAFQQFKEQYARAYRAHHEQYHAASARLTRQLDNVALLLEALVKFNTITELGAPVAADLPSRFQSLSGSLRTCSEKSQALPLADMPFCRSCELRLNHPPPEREAETLLRDLENAWRIQNRRLATLASRHILPQTPASSVDKLAKLVQTADLSSLANVLDDDVMAFLRSFARERPPPSRRDPPS